MNRHGPSTGIQMSSSRSCGVVAGRRPAKRLLEVEVPAGESPVGPVPEVHHRVRLAGATEQRACRCRASARFPAHGCGRPSALGGNANGDSSGRYVTRSSGVSSTTTTGNAHHGAPRHTSRCTITSPLSPGHVRTLPGYAPGHVAAGDPERARTSAEEPATCAPSSRSSSRSTTRSGRSTSSSSASPRRSAAFGRAYEILYVDDGSTDGTFAALERIHAGRCARPGRAPQAELGPASGDARGSLPRPRRDRRDDGRRPPEPARGRPGARRGGRGRATTSRAAGAPRGATPGGGRCRRG